MTGKNGTFFHLFDTFEKSQLLNQRGVNLACDQATAQKVYCIPAIVRLANRLDERGVKTASPPTAIVELICTSTR